MPLPDQMPRDSVHDTTIAVRYLRHRETPAKQADLLGGQMNDYLISVEMWFVGPAASTDDDFENFLDTVLAEVEALDREVTLAARIRERMADFGTVTSADTFDEALAKYLIDLRTALHAAGAATPDWPQFVVRDQKTHELQSA
jgi:hypothetical protein